jgi:hypothetical protein
MYGDDKYVSPDFCKIEEPNISDIDCNPLSTKLQGYEHGLAHHLAPVNNIHVVERQDEGSGTLTSRESMENPEFGN